MHPSRRRCFYLAVIWIACPAADDCLFAPLIGQFQTAGIGWEADLDLDPHWVLSIVTDKGINLA